MAEVLSWTTYRILFSLFIFQIPLQVMNALLISLSPEAQVTLLTWTGTFYYHAQTKGHHSGIHVSIKAALILYREYNAWLLDTIDQSVSSRGNQTSQDLPFCEVHASLLTQSPGFFDSFWRTPYIQLNVYLLEEDMAEVLSWTTYRILFLLFIFQIPLQVMNALLISLSPEAQVTLLTWTGTFYYHAQTKGHHSGIHVSFKAALILYREYNAWLLDTIDQSLSSRGNQTSLVYAVL